MNTIEKAFALTGKMEGGGYESLSGNFDGQGISYGFLQWNLGQGTLQPLLKDMFSANPSAFHQCFTQWVEQEKSTMDLTDIVLSVCNMDTTNAVRWAAARQDDGHRLLHHWAEAFRDLSKVLIFQAVQRKHAMIPYMTLAQEYMDKYGFKSERALCLMFDITVQLGSISAMSRARYYLNSKLTMSEEAKLEVMARSVAPQGGRWVSDVLSRKLTIAKGIGICHSEPYNLEKDFGITMGPVVR